MSAATGALSPRWYENGAPGCYSTSGIADIYSHLRVTNSGPACTTTLPIVTTASISRTNRNHTAWSTTTGAITVLDSAGTLTDSDEVRWTIPAGTNIPSGAGPELDLHLFSDLGFAANLTGTAQSPLGNFSSTTTNSSVNGYTTADSTVCTGMDF